MGQNANKWKLGRFSPDAAAASVSLKKEAIAKRAYEKFIARGGQHGSDEQDWLEAEQELKVEALKRRNN